MFSESKGDLRYLQCDNEEKCGMLNVEGANAHQQDKDDRDEPCRCERGAHVNMIEKRLKKEKTA